MIKGVKLSLAIREKVLNMLIIAPQTRDNDLKLCSNIWFAELLEQKEDPQIMTAFSFMRYYSKGKLSAAETIRRTRQKLQEEAEQGLILPKEIIGTKRKEKNAKQQEIKRDLQDF